jgi:hypothetical protein
VSKFNFVEWDSIMDELLTGELGDNDKDEDVEEARLKEQQTKTENENEDET